MEKEYNPARGEYGLLSAVMTVDKYSNAPINEGSIACKPCQCHCRTCIGGKLPKKLEVIGKEETEKIFKALLAA